MRVGTHLDVSPTVSFYFIHATLPCEREGLWFRVQGYLAHKKTHTPRTTIWALGIGLP